MTEQEEILLQFETMGIDRINLCRVFSLPFDTFKKDPADDPLVLTLLKILRLYPWMVEVVEAKYDKTVVKRVALYHAGQTISREAVKIGQNERNSNAE